MHRVFNTVLKISLFIFILTGITMLAGLGYSAGAQECSIGIVKEAVGAGDLVFNFVTQDPDGSGEFSLTDGQGTGGPFSSSPFVIRELPTQGWALSHVDCISDGLSITKLRDGVSIVCVTPQGTGTCTFVNVPFVPAVPTLSEWGMISAAAGLGMIGVFFAVRRKRAQV
jgi:hypothetical protein